MRVFLLARHAQSQLNVERRVNGDPALEVPLTEQGLEEAARLGLQVANLPLDLAVHTRFGRTEATLRAALGDRDVPLREEPLLDDIDVGDLEGRTIDDYRAWKREHRALRSRSPAARASTTPRAGTRGAPGRCSRSTPSACSSSATRSRCATS